MIVSITYGTYVWSEGAAGESLTVVCANGLFKSRNSETVLDIAVYWWCINVGLEKENLKNMYIRILHSGSKTTAVFCFGFLILHGLLSKTEKIKKYSNHWVWIIVRNPTCFLIRETKFLNFFINCWIFILFNKSLQYFSSIYRNSRPIQTKILEIWAKINFTFPPPLIFPIEILIFIANKNTYYHNENIRPWTLTHSWWN